MAVSKLSQYTSASALDSFVVELKPHVTAMGGRKFLIEEGHYKYSYSLNQVLAKLKELEKSKPLDPATKKHITDALKKLSNSADQQLASKPSFVKALHKIRHDLGHLINQAITERNAFDKYEIRPDDEKSPQDEDSSSSSSNSESSKDSDTPPAPPSAKFITTENLPDLDSESSSSSSLSSSHDAPETIFQDTRPVEISLLEKALSIDEVSEKIQEFLRSKDTTRLPEMMEYVVSHSTRNNMHDNIVLTLSIILKNDCSPSDLLLTIFSVVKLRAEKGDSDGLKNYDVRLENEQIKVELVKLINKRLTFKGDLAIHYDIIRSSMVGRYLGKKFDQDILLIGILTGNQKLVTKIFTPEYLIDLIHSDYLINRSNIKPYDLSNVCDVILNLPEDIAKDLKVTWIAKLTQLMEFFGYELSEEQKEKFIANSYPLPTPSHPELRKFNSFFFQNPINRSLIIAELWNKKIEEKEDLFSPEILDKCRLDIDDAEFKIVQMTNLLLRNFFVHTLEGMFNAIKSLAFYSSNRELISLVINIILSDMPFDLDLVKVRQIVNGVNGSHLSDLMSETQKAQIQEKYPEAFLHYHAELEPLKRILENQQDQKKAKILEALIIMKKEGSIAFLSPRLLGEAQSEINAFGRHSLNLPFAWTNTYATQFDMTTEEFLKDVLQLGIMLGDPNVVQIALEQGADINSLHAKDPIFTMLSYVSLNQIDILLDLPSSENTTQLMRLIMSRMVKINLSEEQINKFYTQFPELQKELKVQVDNQLEKRLLTGLSSSENSVAVKSLKECDKDSLAVVLSYLEIDELLMMKDSIAQSNEVWLQIAEQVGYKKIDFLLTPHQPLKEINVKTLLTDNHQALSRLLFDQLLPQTKENMLLVKTTSDRMISCSLAVAFADRVTQLTPLPQSVKDLFNTLTPLVSISQADLLMEFTLAQEWLVENREAIALYYTSNTFDLASNYPYPMIIRELLPPLIISINDRLLGFVLNLTTSKILTRKVTLKD